MTHQGVEQLRAFALFPVELCLRIVSYLDLKDVVALRQTCKYFLEVCQDRGLWISLFNRVREMVPLPCSQTEFQALSTPQAQRVLCTAVKVNATVMEYRERVRCCIKGASPSKIAGHRDPQCWRTLSFISERFLLSVHDTAVKIWDVSRLISSAAPSEPWAHFDLANFIIHAEHNSTLYISAVEDQGDQKSISIYSIPLPPLGESQNRDGKLRLEAKFPLRESEQLRHLEPSLGRALLYCPTGHIDIVHWHDENKRSTIPIRHNGERRFEMIALRVCGPYILCFGLRTVTAYPIPTEDLPAGSLPELVHRFDNAVLAQLSVSRIRRATCASGEMYTLFILAFNEFRGMAHYRIQVKTRPLPLLSVHALADNEDHSVGFTLPFGVVKYIPWQTCVSTSALGLGGLHGVWVNPAMNMNDHGVLAFRTPPIRLRVSRDSPHWGRENFMGSQLHEEVVHIITSGGPQDDIEICAMSDWNGLIALGTRRGDILLL